ncbi:hypothetical protein HRI_002841500 [Hibiscus trionum]|uniref:Late embryogenesis abundant protein LEA-2 subgroup domain-containing protein n=1 Tax=Hibiscus trionum TaxID=183268 RepID=A0A9W7I9A9_HIBTR|nr:hypothetical protein HRI_002841500 [Hibiscus trionum]
MRAPMHHSGCLPLRQPSLKQERFLRRCCFFLSLYLLVIVSTVGLGGLMVVFVLKPQKPVFSVQTVTLDAYQLNVYSNSTLFVSAVASLVLNASNPNKISLGYSPSRLQLYSEGLPMAVIRVPGFFQPAHSKNVSLTTRVLIPCVNVSQVLSGGWLQDQQGQSIVPMKLSGDIKVNLHFPHITLPKIKVALDCDMNFEYRDLAFLNEVYVNKTAKGLLASFSNGSKSFLKKCALAIYI